MSAWTTRKCANRMADGNPRIPVRNAADRCWSRHETMVWFSCTLTSVIVPSVVGCERAGPGTAHPGPAHALTRLPAREMHNELDGEGNRSPLTCCACDRTLGKDGDQLPRPARPRRVLLPGAGDDSQRGHGRLGGHRSQPGLRELAFQRVTEWVPPRWPDPAYPQQLHLDIRVPDADQAERDLLTLGATRVPGERETGFRVFTDPSATHSALSSAATDQADQTSAHAAIRASKPSRYARESPHVWSKGEMATG